MLPALMSDSLIKAFGWRALLIHGDPCVLDRWLWLRRHLRKGALRTFDAGCGNGAFSIYAALEGNEVLAASFSEREQDDARRRAELVGATGIDFRLLDLRELAGACELTWAVRPDHLLRDDRAPDRR